MSHKQMRNVILSCLSLLTLLLAACRSASSTIDIKGEIEPDPIVGEIVTLRIEVISEKFSGDGVIGIRMSDEVNLVSSGPDWQRISVTDDPQKQFGNTFEWQGHLAANEPQIHEISFCVTQPGWWKINMSASIFGDEEKVIDGINSDLHIVSMVDSAEVIPSSEYEVRQPPLESTPIPTPEPVTVSAECSGSGVR